MERAIPLHAFCLLPRLSEPPSRSEALEPVKTDATHQVRETRISAYRVQQSFDFEVRHSVGTLAVTFFEPSECLFLIKQPRRDSGQIDCRDEPLLPKLLQLVQ